MVEKKRPRRDDDDDKTDFEANEDPKVSRPQRRFQRRRQTVFVPDYVDWKDVDYLRRFIPVRATILPRRISTVTPKDQRRIARAIKRARAMALLLTRSQPWAANRPSPATRIRERAFSSLGRGTARD